MKKNILIFSKKISEALRVLNTSKAKTVFVINNKKQIIGTITDGDIRRGFLKGYDINKNLIFFMKKKFKFIFKKDLKNKQKLSELTIKEINKIEKGLTTDVLKVFELKKSVNSKVSYGGTSFDNIKKMILSYKKK